MQMLTNSQNTYQDIAYPNEKSYGESHVGGGGAKKSLTPTSSDERKRPKAKKLATERAVAQQQSYYQHGHHYSESAMYNNNFRCNHVRSMSNGSSSNTDSEGRHRPPVPPRTHVPNHLRNRPFHQSAPSSSPGISPQRSTMRRNNSDVGAVSQRSILTQLRQTNMAHVKQIASKFPNERDSTTVSHTQLPLADESGTSHSHSIFIIT